MVKARFITEQQPITVKNYGDLVYVFICINGELKTDIRPLQSGDCETDEYWEYDYNEISAKRGEIDIDDIKANPEKYLNYTSKTDSERIKELEEQQALTDQAVQDILLMTLSLAEGQ